MPEPLTFEDLADQEAALEFAHFTPTDAWQLGTSLAERAIASEYPVVIDIRRPGFVLFHAALEGSTPDQDEWVSRKSSTVLRMDMSSRRFAARIAAGSVDPFANGWLNERYTLAGGSIPIRVKGVGLVAAVTVSGLPSHEDHDFIVEGIAAAFASVPGLSAAEAVVQGAIK
ncbi:heme-degrading domain-containing protein [Microbacterium sp. GXF0217]